MTEELVHELVAFLRTRLLAIGSVRDSLDREERAIMTLLRRLEALKDPK